MDANTTHDHALDLTDAEYEELRGGPVLPGRFDLPQDPQRAIEQMIATMRQIYGVDFARDSAA